MRQTQRNWWLEKDWLSMAVVLSEMKYEKVGSVEMAMSGIGIAEALVKCGWVKPVLRVAPVDVAWASLNLQCLANVEPDEELSPLEWYIEYNGKRVGSLGC